MINHVYRIYSLVPQGSVGYQIAEDGISTMVAPHAFYTVDAAEAWIEQAIMDGKRPLGSIKRPFAS